MSGHALFSYGGKGQPVPPALVSLDRLPAILLAALRGALLEEFPMAEPILVAQHGDVQCLLLPPLANRHGLITGATGTGKTITLQTLAENFSRQGVPVFMADVKGDLTGITQKGSLSERLAALLKERGLHAPEPAACPATLWDVFGEQGHPVRATVSDMGPLLLARMLALNETQSGVLQLAFKIADDHGLLLLDMKDLRAMLQHLGDHAAEFTTEYGNVSPASIGAIQRGLLQIESQGGAQFFGEPMLNIADFMQTVDGQGVVNILAADKLLNAPRLYATFLLWLLSELFESLPEVGDLDKPKLVFFFDEAHLLFKDAPAALIERIELVVRLVRSKGVGVYFVTQNPLDIPDTVLGQLGNRVQHALRAFTPRDQKAVKAAAETMRQNPTLDIATAITELAVGEALLSLLDEKGRPSITERAFVLPPGSQIGPITAAQRQALMQNSLVAGAYEQAIDRESAYEKLKGRAVAGAQANAPVPIGEPSAPVRPSPSPAPSPAPAPIRTSAPAPEQGGGAGGWLRDVADGLLRGSGRKDSVLETVAKSAARSIGSSVGREIVRGVLGSLLGGGSSRRR
jgi:DNA helicase HerA-like ATPase